MAFALARQDASEYLDRPGHDDDELAGNLADLARINRWLGGARLTIRGIQTLEAGHPSAGELLILDVGTGAGDVPAALVRWGQRQRRGVRVLATDVSPEILHHARERSGERLRLAVADGRHLPLADRAVDVSTCSLVLHHLPPPEAVALLRELARVARRGVVVNDLVRGWFGYAAAVALARVGTRNRLTRHDAPLSVRRAYTVPELAALTRLAGLTLRRLHYSLGYRVALVVEAA